MVATAAARHIGFDGGPAVTCDHLRKIRANITTRGVTDRNARCNGNIGHLGNTTRDCFIQDLSDISEASPKFRGNQLSSDLIAPARSIYRDETLVIFI
jgi:hypothetical protein